MKVCLKCGREKVESDFSKDSRNKDGLQSWCKECLNEKVRIRYTKNIDVINEKRRAVYQSSEDKRKAQADSEKKYRERGGRKALYDSRTEEFLAIARAWRDRNKGKIKAKNARHKALNAAKLSELLKMSVRNLDDKYVMRVIRASMDWMVPAKDIPPDLIEIYRTKIITQRQLKQAS